MTLGALKAFEELGIKCPDEMALATFDDLAVDHSFHPHLTAVVQPSYEIGARAATILIDRIEGKLKGRLSVVRIVPALVVRESTSRKISELHTPATATRRGIRSKATR
jgi:LacI family transcriptional regulator